MPRTPIGSGARARAPRRLRTPAGERGGDRRAPVEEEGPRDLQLRRHQLVGLCDRGDPACPASSRGAGAPAPLGPGRDRDRDPPRRRRRVSYRQVCRAYPNGGGAYVVAKNEPRAGLRAGRRRRPAHRLRDDRGRLDGFGDRADPLGHPRCVRRPDRDRVHRRSRSSRSRTCAACASPGTSSRCRPTCSSGWRSRSSASASSAS